MELKGIRVVVEARNVALPEYEVKMQDSSAVCFVPSKAGANFQVTVYNSSRRPVEFRVYLDGSFAQNFLAHTGKHATMKGMQVDRETMRLFEFTVLNLTDDESLPLGGVDLEALGTIRVDIFRVEYRGSMPQNYRADNSESLDGHATVHEKTKKAGSHRIQLGTSVQSSVKTAQVVHVDPVHDEPYARFTFRYRPTDMLQAQGIIPSSSQSSSQPRLQVRTHTKRRAYEDVRRPSPKRPRMQSVSSSSRTAVDQDDDEILPKDEPEEMEDLLTQRAALEAKIRAMEARRVKREPSPIVLRTATHKEVIDLTWDSD